MLTILIVLHLMVVIALVATVLLQRSEGGALGVGGGGGFMTGRGQANALTRATAILGTLFFLTSIGLTLLARYNHPAKLDLPSSPGVVRTQPGAPAPAGSNPLDQLRDMEQKGVAPATTPSAPPPPAQPEVPKSQ